MLTRLCRLPAGSMIALAAALIPTVDALAQDEADTPVAQARPEDGPTYPVGRFRIEYVRENPDLPPVEPIRRLEVELVRVPGGWVGPRPVPLLEKAKRYPAWLSKMEAGHFVPAARGYSFERVADPMAAPVTPTPK